MKMKFTKDTRKYKGVRTEKRKNVENFQNKNLKQELL
jgi:hypothetical protein